MASRLAAGILFYLLLGTTDLLIKLILLQYIFQFKLGLMHGKNGARIKVVPVAYGCFFTFWGLDNFVRVARLEPTPTLVKQIISYNFSTQPSIC